MYLLPILLTASVLLSGCGTKGPLYLPEQVAPSKRPRSVVTPPASPERPTPAETAPVPESR